MSTVKYKNCEEILKKVMIELGVTSNKALAEKLGVSANTISTWKKRGTLDIGKILLVCESAKNWIIASPNAVESIIPADPMHRHTPDESGKDIISDYRSDKSSPDRYTLAGNQSSGYDSEDASMLKNKLIAVYEKRIVELEGRVKELEGMMGKRNAQESA